MIKKISEKLKRLIKSSCLLKKEQEIQKPPVERRRGDRRTNPDRRWMSKLFNGEKPPIERRRGERRIGDRRKK
jgi:hypothetical protein